MNFLIVFLFLILSSIKIIAESVGDNREYGSLHITNHDVSSRTENLSNFVYFSNCHDERWVFRPDGQMIVYSKFNFNSQSREALWRSSTGGLGAIRVQFSSNAGIRLLDASGSVVWRSPLSNAVSPGTPFKYIIRDNGVPAVLDANDRVLWQPTGTSFAMNGRQCRWGKTSRTRRIEQGEAPLTVGQYLVTSYDYRLIVIEPAFNGGKNALMFVDAKRNIVWSIPDVAKVEITSTGRLQLKSTSGSVLHQTEPNQLVQPTDDLLLEVTFDNFARFALLSQMTKTYRLPDVFNIQTTNQSPSTPTTTTTTGRNGATPTTNRLSSDTTLNNGVIYPRTTLTSFTNSQAMSTDDASQTAIIVVVVVVVVLVCCLLLCAIVAFAVIWSKKTKQQTLDDTYNVNELHVTTNTSPTRQAPPNNYRGLSSSGETSASSHDPYKTRNYQGQSISSNYPTEAYEGLAARTTQSTSVVSSNYAGDYTTAEFSFNSNKSDF